MFRKKPPQPDLRVVNPDDNAAPSIREQVKGIPVIQVALIAGISTMAGIVATAIYNNISNRLKEEREKREKLEREREQLEKEVVTLAASEREPSRMPTPSLKDYNGKWDGGAARRSRLQVIEPGQAPTPDKPQHLSPEELAQWEANLRAWQQELAQREMRNRNKAGANTG